MPLTTTSPTQWTLSETQAIALQTAQAPSVIITDQFATPVRYIGGIDVAYSQVKDKMVAAVAIIDAVTLELQEVVTAEATSPFPYIPTLFSFREIPPIAKVFEQLHIVPELFICDGHGVAHPRKFGLASHLGVLYDIPTIGCGKSYLTGQYDKNLLGTRRGDYLPLLDPTQQEIGRALRTQDNVNPLFVSVGHKVSLPTACEWILKLCAFYRQPEVIRHADHAVRSYSL